MNIGEFLAAHTCTTAPAKRSAQEEPFFISSNSHLLNMSVNKKNIQRVDQFPKLLHPPSGLCASSLLSSGVSVE